jgi:hypothetical protein
MSSGSISKTRQNEALAVRILKSPERNSKGSIDAATIAKKVAASLKERVGGVIGVAFGVKGPRR